MAYSTIDAVLHHYQLMRHIGLLTQMKWNLGFVLKQASALTFVEKVSTVEIQLTLESHWKTTVSTKTLSLTTE